MSKTKSKPEASKPEASKPEAPKTGVIAAANAADAVLYEDFADILGEAEFVDASPPEIDGFYNPEKCGPFAGKLVGRIEIASNKPTDKARDIVLVRLIKPAKGMVKSDDEPVSLEAGQVLAVDVKFKLLSLLEYVTHQGIVVVIPLEKIKIKGGKTMWRFGLKASGVKAPPPPPARAGAPQNMPENLEESDADDSGGGDTSFDAALS